MHKTEIVEELNNIHRYIIPKKFQQHSSKANFVLKSWDLSI